jgi:hypothetical protein
MQTIQCLEKSKQQRKADQTRQEFAPLARTLGLVGIAGELDALATTVLGDATVQPALQRPPNASLTITHGLLRAAAQALLPAHCRQRWLSEWEAELYELPSRHDKLGAHKIGRYLRWAPADVFDWLEGKRDAG